MLLEQVIEKKIALGCEDRYSALRDIKKSLETVSPYDFAKMFRVLANDSAEDFMIEYMTAFNKEVYPAY